MKRDFYEYGSQVIKQETMIYILLVVLLIRMHDVGDIGYHLASVLPLT